MELVCPAGSLPSLRAAVDNGADAVYIGFRDGLNARNFPGLNFERDEAQVGVRYAHDRGVRLFVAMNVYPRAWQWPAAVAAIDQVASLGVDALILADPGLMRHARERHPGLNLHLSVQSSATNWRALEFYRREFGVRRAVLPRVLSLAQVRNVIARTKLEIEVFGFGSLCVMVEGRCALSSYVTGESPNSHGVCSPAHAVRWAEKPNGRESRLNGVLIDRFAPGEHAGYPTLCKGRFEAGGHVHHALEEPASLNVLGILPQLLQAGVRAIKIEGRQRSPAYVAQVTRAMRAELDACTRDIDDYQPGADSMRVLDRLAEGSSHTLGAFDRPWQ
ncbi:MAG TPA: peptidase U32 family protein [Steroidobacteraceae bacterium]|nr:peptidase U32 family protein [Steroidobacteraceae bacterium]